MKYFRFLLLLTLCCLPLTGCGGEEVPSSVPAGGIYTPDPLAVDVGTYYADFPEGIQPAVYVGGRTYYWGGGSSYLYNTGVPEAEVYSVGNGEPYLPEGFTSVGPISSITTDVPTEENQLRGAFEAEGEVYVNPNVSEAVYVWMGTDWNEGFYGRFISTELATERIRYGGRDYAVRIGYSDSEVLEELPSGAELVGTLHYIGEDLLPKQDLETNCAGDSFSKALEGREVYFDPATPDVLYYYEHHYWAEGDYPTYRSCPVITQ